MSLKGDWGYVKNMMQTPCNNGDVSIFIETAAAAAGIAMLDIITYGCREPLKWALGRGQVKNMFGTRSRGINNPLTHRKPRTGGNMHPGGTRSGPSFFWHFQGLFERALYLWMLADVTKDGVLNWSSMMMAANGCGGPYVGYCQFNIQPQVVGPNPTELLIAPLPDCHGVISDIRHIYIPLGVTSSVGYQAQAVPWAPGNTPGATLSTFLADTGTGDAWAAAQQGAPGSGDNGVVGFNNNVPGRTAGFRQLSIVGQSSGYSFITKGTVSVTLRGRPVKIFSPSDCFKARNNSAFDKWLAKQFE